MAKITFSCGPALLLAMSGGTDSHTWAVDFLLWLLATGPGSAIQLAGSHCRRFLQGTQGGWHLSGTGTSCASASTCLLPESFMVANEFHFFSFPLEERSCFFVWWIKRRGSRVPWFDYSFPVTEPWSCSQGLLRGEGRREMNWWGMSGPYGLRWQSSFLLSALLLQLPWTQGLS